jgi:hypothetical protein
MALQSSTTTTWSHHSSSKSGVLDSPMQAGLLQVGNLQHWFVYDLMVTSHVWASTLQLLFEMCKACYSSSPVT